MKNGDATGNHRYGPWSIAVAVLAQVLMFCALVSFVSVLWTDPTWLWAATTAALFIAADLTHRLFARWARRAGLLPAKDVR